MKFIFDMSSVLWTSILYRRDEENGYEIDHEGKKVWVNSGLYGFEGAVSSMYKIIEQYGAPKDAILVWEGMSSKQFRQRMEPNADYKGNRPPRPDAVNLEFGKAKQMLTDFWRDLGALQVTQDRIEADDVIAHIADHLEEDCLVYSNDGDMSVLCGKNAKGFDVHVGNNKHIDENPVLPSAPHSLITIYKATVGDSSDNIKGAYKFGHKSFLKMLGMFGQEGVEQIEQMIINRDLSELQENVADLPELRRLLDSADSVFSSYRLAQLYPDMVNTLNNPLQWTYGKVRMASDRDDPRFAKWYGKNKLVTADNYDDALAKALKYVKQGEFVALDLETSTPEESDEWLFTRNKGKAKDAGVDVLASKITGGSLTYGENMNHTVYICVDHKDCNNVSAENFASFIFRVTEGKRTICHNAGGFELPVLKLNGLTFPGEDKWDDFLPDVHCTQLLNATVDENLPRGLKQSAKHYLDYDQATYEETTQGRKMNELTGEEVLAYGCDDTIVTAALYQHHRTVSQCEDTWQQYLKVEQLPMYAHAQEFINGFKFSLEVMREMEDEDDEKFDQAWKVVRSYLMKAGWRGTECPWFGEFTPKTVKTAYEILTGVPLETKLRKPERLLELIWDEQEDIAPLFETWYEQNEPQPLQVAVEAAWQGEPQFNAGSPKQMGELMYEKMDLPIRLRNAATEIMMRAGRSEGNPKTNEDAITIAAYTDADELQKEVLLNILEMKAVKTRRSFYYDSYPVNVHWLTGKIHSQAKQSHAVTGRGSSAKINKQQMPKRGEAVKFRCVMRPHKRGAVIVPMDFDGQELRLAADDSQDKNFLACYIGDNKLDLHSFTAAGMAESPQFWGEAVEYKDFLEMLNSDNPEIQKKAGDLRKGAKTGNFASQYGAYAITLAIKMRCSVEAAQAFLDAREEMFPGLQEWNDDLIAQASQDGFMRTRMGRRRHLREQLLDDDGGVVARAERQAVNHRIQGSAGEQTKLAVAQMQEEALFRRFDAQFLGPIHDEVVASVMVDDLFDFIPAMHRCMIQPYGEMVVPIESSISFGPSFGEQIEIGLVPSREAIEQGLEKLNLLEATV